MKKKMLLLSALLTVAILAAGCQPAGEGEGTPGPLETPVLETPMEASPAAETPLAETPTEETPVEETPLATETEGAVPPTGEEVLPDLSSDLFQEYTVQLQDGSQVGSVVDLVVDLNQGRLVYLVISLQQEGALTTGTATPATQGEQAVAQGVPVPWELVSIDEQQRIVTLEVDQEQLQGAPTVDLNTWPDPSDPEWDAEIRSYWGTEASSAG